MVQELEDNKEIYKMIKVKRSEIDSLKLTNTEQTKYIEQLEIEKKQVDALVFNSN